METVSSDQIRTHVVHSLDDNPVGFDVDGIVTKLVSTYPVVGPNPEMSCDDIPHDEYWDIVFDHMKVL